MALAVVALKNKEIERIVLTRPAVEAGEKLGFLPGDLTQKVQRHCQIRLARTRRADGEREVMVADGLHILPLPQLRRGDLVDRTRIRYAIALAREGDVDRIDEILRSVFLARTRRADGEREVMVADGLHILLLPQRLAANLLAAVFD